LDGYLGWSLALYLGRRGHEVGGCDLLLRRGWVDEMGSYSATPIREMPERLQAFRENFGKELIFLKGDLCDYPFVLDCFQSFCPDAIVHLGEMPLAPYSMIDVRHCTFTMINDLIGTINILYAMKAICPEAHLLKLGTMGEYGTPDLDIPEGFITIEFRSRIDTLPFPRQANSWYH
jgi:UDP-sulfoquinovose synthase